MAPISGPSNLAYDYTEGASPTEIEEALSNSRYTRRDSDYENIYGDDGEGAMFSGPGHSVNPSSVSRMSNIEFGRRSSDAWSLNRRRSRDSGLAGQRKHKRRDSRDSRASRRSVDSISQFSDTVEGSPLDDGRISSRKSRRQDEQSPPPRSSVFDNFAQLFGKRKDASGIGRRSISRRSSRSTSRSQRRRYQESESEYALDTEEEADRWGYLSEEESSGDEGNRENMSITPSMEYDSEPASPPNATQSLPLLSSDPVFGGEARIDIETLPDSLDVPPPGPPSRQAIYIPDEDITVRFVGYETRYWHVRMWWFGCVITCGLLGLLGHWFPRIWLKWVAREKAFKDCKEGFVVVETAHRDISLFPVHLLPYPYPISTAFPPNVPPSERLPSEYDECQGYNPESGLLSHLLVVDYRYTRFGLDPRTGLFTLIRNWRDPSWTSIMHVAGGLESSVREQRLRLFGRNEINIEGKSTIGLLVDEVIHPFYVFQIASIILWSLDDYYYYAFCIALISIISITTTLIDTQKTIARMRDMSKFSCKVHVFIDGTWQERDSFNLVPGDIVNLSTSQFSLIPSDLFLLTGDSIVNESMLTGESVPVSKVPAKDDDLSRWKDLKDENPKAFLYAGTRVVRIRGTLPPDGSHSRPAVGMITRTGFNTTKGALIRSMLFPKPIGFKFYRDSVRFIGVLALLAGVGFCFSAVQFVRIGLQWHTILVRALDLITVVVPPALPATLSIGTSFAIGRLRKFGIFCISPSRVNVGGKVNVCCFDKTGTLTEDGLDILGIRAIDKGNYRFGELLEDIHDLPLESGKASFMHALATCHSLKLVEGEVIGDPLDVKMFNFTGWTLEEGNLGGVGIIKSRPGGILEQAALVQTVVRPPGTGNFRVEDAMKGAAKRTHFLELGVIRTFEFVSALRRMSVVVKRLKGISMEIYVKGAPEVMGDICEPDSFPQDYEDLLSYYTKRGYRVIAIAGKSLDGLTWRKAQRMKREQAESGLRFLGLVIFENRLKLGTTPAIQALRAAHLACRMITGDNPLTAVSVARECSLIHQSAHVFSPVFVHGNADTPASKLEWSCVDDVSWKLDDYSLKPLAPPPHHTVEGDGVDYLDYSLVITGDVFRWMLNYTPLETLQRMLVKTQIFARMSPDEKNEVVERLQSLGYTVLMCGDGANDCSALKAADVGISLSEAEASVAAPFTSSTPDISCVLEVIKEGRASLVTSFSCFKYMALYSLIQFTSVTLLYSFASSLGDFQFLYIDLFIIIPVAVTMGRTLPYPNLHTKRPTASLVSKKVLVSIIGQVVINGAVQIWAYFWVREQSWYTPPPTPDPSSGSNRLESTNYENTALFLVSSFQYVLVAAVFSIGPPYRKSMWTNGWLMASFVALTGLNLVVLLSPPQVVSDILTLMPLPLEARYALLVAVLINVMVSMGFEEWGSGWVAKIIGTWTEWWQGRRRIGKGYKMVDGGGSEA